MHKTLTANKSISKRIGKKTRNEFSYINNSLKDLVPNTFDDFGDEGDPTVVGDDDDADDPRWLGFVD